MGSLALSSTVYACPMFSNFLPHDNEGGAVLAALFLYWKDMAFRVNLKTKQKFFLHRNIKW